MNRLFALLLTGLVLGACAFADGGDVKHNFYAGISLNLNSLSGKRSDSASDITPAATILNDNKRSHANTTYAGISVGYFFRIENFGIGPEFFYNYGKMECTSNRNFDIPGLATTNFRISHKLLNQSGAFVRLGYFFGDYFLYTLFGLHYQAGYFETIAQHLDPLGSLTQYEYKTKRKNLNTSAFGFGLQKKVSQNYSIGLEYKFSKFPNKNFIWDLNEPNKTTLQSSFKYQIYSINLKLIYVF